MPVADQQEQNAQQEQNDNEQQGRSSGVPAAALKAAAAAAATGAATYAVRKIMSRDDSSQAGENGKSATPDKQHSGEGMTSSLSSIASSAGSSAWEAASGALLPLAEDAAEAAGKYLAEHAPDVVRERIVPRFIEAFNEAG